MPNRYKDHVSVKYLSKTVKVRYNGHNIFTIVNENECTISYKITTILPSRSHSRHQIETASRHSETDLLYTLKVKGLHTPKTAASFLHTFL